MSRHVKIVALCCVGMFFEAGAGLHSAADTLRRRRISVEDTIQMTILPETTYTSGEGSSSRFARFSPDGKKFVVVTERGHPETNENEYSLLLYTIRDVWRSRKAQLLCSMHSRSNRDAIKNVKWAGNEHLYFVGEAHGTSQVYALSIPTKRLVRLTNQPTPVVDFGIDSAGEIIVYAAEPGRPSEQSVSERIERGYAITLETFGEVPRSRAGFFEPDLAQGEELFLKKRGEKAVHIPLRDRYMPLSPVSVAPDGQHAVFRVLLREVPPSWIDYADEFIRPEVKAYRRKGSTSWLMRYMVLDTKTAVAKPLLPGPVDWLSNGTAWSADSKRIAVSGAFLPLEISDPQEREARKKHPFGVEVDPETGQFDKITDEALIVTGWDAKSGRVQFRSSSQAATLAETSYVKGPVGWVKAPDAVPQGLKNVPEIKLEQDLNTPPKLYVQDPSSGRENVLLDLNPQLADFALGKVEAIRWKASDGHEVEGGLYLPPDYQPGVRYPVVLQTHGFSKNEYWINGPWNSGYAAQPLAAQGIVVLQIGHGTEPGGYLKHHRSMEEAPREMAAYEGAIDYLDGRGIVDRSRIGILGFSRTQYHVEYTLTHSSYPFLAATLIDGFDGGYLEYLANPYSEKDEAMVNGGPPFGATFANWMQHSPSFRIDHVHTPIRMECHDWGVVSCWEWYSMLTHMERPVELIYLPDALHTLLKPWERMTSQQGNVDWFCFWLKGEEDQDPKKKQQYERWRAMRESSLREPANLH